MCTPVCIITDVLLSEIISWLDPAEIDIKCVLSCHMNEDAMYLKKEGYKSELLPIDDIGVCQNSKNTVFIVGTSSVEVDERIQEKLISMGHAKETIILLSAIISNRHVYYAYLNALKHIQTSTEQIDFFATGISYMETGLDLPSMQPYNGVNLSLASQDLFYGYQVAKFLFASEKKFRFALIGLAPYSFQFNMSLTKASWRVLNYLSVCRELNPLIVSNKKDIMERIFNKKYTESYESMNPDLLVNMNDLYGNRAYQTEHVRPSVKDALLAKCTVEDLSGMGKSYPETERLNRQLLVDYIHLCKAHDVVPIGIIMPFHETFRRHYPQEKMNYFFSTLADICNQEEFPVMNFWESKLSIDCFTDFAHLNLHGAELVSSYIKNAIIQRYHWKPFSRKKV